MSALFLKLLIITLLASLLIALLGRYLFYFNLQSAVGGLTHAMIGGVGLGLFMGVSPVIGMIFFGLLISIIFAYIQSKSVPSHLFISVLWGGGISFGTFLLSFVPDSGSGLMSYFLGNILIVSTSDMIYAGILFGLFAFWSIFYDKALKVLSFDLAFARLEGYPVFLIFFGLFAFITCSVILLAQILGILILMTFLIIPSYLAFQLTHRHWLSLGISFILSVFLMYGGILLSFVMNTPISATVVLFGILILCSFQLFFIVLKKVIHRSLS